MMQTFRKISLYAATLWLGMQIMAGYIVAPVLFKMLPKMQAGEIAGVLFDILSWSGLAVWGAVLAAAFAALTRRQTTLLLFFIVRPCRQPILDYTRYRGAEIRA